VSKNTVDFVVVPDITVNGAFDKALKDVAGVLHVASPLPKEVGHLLSLPIANNSPDKGK
jgi:nucleoside-diphosphate-sugar epimerase